MKNLKKRLPRRVANNMRAANDWRVANNMHASDNLRFGGLRWLIVGLMLGLASIAAPAAAVPDPVMITLGTGSRVATWTVPATATPRKTPVIFLHGGPGMFTTEAAIKKGAALRATGFTTIYFDQAGGGKSDRLPAAQYSLRRAVDDVEALRIAIGAERIIVWGSSYGADVAAIYARLYPARIAALIFSSPGMLPGLTGKRDYSRTNRGNVDISGPLAKAITLIDRKGAAVESEYSQAATGALFDELVNAELLDAGVCKGAPPRSGPRLTGGNLYANRMIQRDVRKTKLPAGAPLAQPVLIVRGECDFLSLANAQAYQRAFGGEFAAIARSGHNLSENPADYDAVLTRFGQVALANVE